MSIKIFKNFIKIWKFLMVFRKQDESGGIDNNYLGTWNPHGGAV